MPFEQGIEPPNTFRCLSSAAHSLWDLSHNDCLCLAYTSIYLHLIVLISHNFSTYTYFIYPSLPHSHAALHLWWQPELRPGGQHNLNPGVVKCATHTWRLSGCNNPNKIRIHTHDQSYHSLCRKGQFSCQSNLLLANAARGCRGVFCSLSTSHTVCRTLCYSLSTGAKCVRVFECRSKNHRPG